MANIGHFLYAIGSFSDLKMVQFLQLWNLHSEKFFCLAVCAPRTNLRYDL